ncbi:MAG: lipopolysaccharide assembly protein LapA domain-containing protein [Thiotrichaceae bacterium]
MRNFDILAINIGYHFEIGDNNVLYLMVWIVWVVLFVVTAALTIPNSHLVVFNYYFASVELSISLLFLLILSLGMLLGLSFNGLRVWGLQRDNRRLRKLHKQTLHEINTLLANVKQDTPR